MTDPTTPEPSDRDPAPSSLSREELLDLCASTSLDRSLGAGAGGADNAGERAAGNAGGSAAINEANAPDLDTELRVALDAAGITQGEIAARRARFAAGRAALLAGAEGDSTDAADELAPARRTRAVRSAIAAALDEPRPGGPTDSTDRDERLPAVGGAIRPRPAVRDRGDRLRRIAAAAAAVMVIAGIGALALGGRGGGDSDETADTAAETAEASADDTGAASGGDDEALDAPTVAGPPEARAPDDSLAEAFADGIAWIDLGPVASADAALERWRRLAVSVDGTDAEERVAATTRAEVATDPSVQECVARLRSDGAVVVGTGELPRGLVLLARVEGTSTVRVIEVATCSVLASARIG